MPDGPHRWCAAARGSILRHVSEFRCDDCGFIGAPEEVAPGLVVCAGCGARVRGASERSVLHRARFSVRRRLLGGRLSAAREALRDEDGRAIAACRVRPSLGRGLAVLVGAGLFTASVLGLVTLLELVALERWLEHAVIYATMPGLLVAAIVVVVRLSPGPDLVLVALGHDPRLLLHVHPERERGFESRLAVEDAEGVPIGELVLHRLRDRVWPLGHARPLIVILAPGRSPILVRRRSRFVPGWVFEQDARPVASYALEAPSRALHELVIDDTDCADPRLFVAAMMVGRP